MVGTPRQWADEVGVVTTGGRLLTGSRGSTLTFHAETTSDRVEACIRTFVDKSIGPESSVEDSQRSLERFLEAGDRAAGDGIDSLRAPLILTLTRPHPWAGGAAVVLVNANDDTVEPACVLVNPVTGETEVRRDVPEGQLLSDPMVAAVERYDAAAARHADDDDDV